MADYELLELSSSTYKKLQQLAKEEFRSMEDQIRYMLSKRKPGRQRKSDGRKTINWSDERREKQRERMVQLNEQRGRTQSK